MKNFIICKMDSRHFYLLCMNYESILNYLDQIENSKEILENEGLLIIDQLLVTGDGKNRFIACRFVYGTVDLSTARNVHPKDEYKELTSCLLKKNMLSLNSSILTESQKGLIEKGHAI